VLARLVFTDFTLRSVQGKLPFGEGGVGMCAARSRMCAVLSKASEHAAKLRVHQHRGFSNTMILETLDNEPSIPEI
jgi:hypothetical protein